MKGIAVATKLFGRSSKSYQVIQTMVLPLSAWVCEGHPFKASWQLQTSIGVRVNANGCLSLINWQAVQDVTPPSFLHSWDKLYFYTSECLTAIM